MAVVSGARPVEQRRDGFADTTPLNVEEPSSSRIRRLRAARLVVEIRDNGVGGADPVRGTGLTGLADRADAQGGTLTLSSRTGGPTILRLELPWTA